MIRNQHDEQQICHKHNLPLEFENPDKSKPNQLYVCNQCIIEYYQPIPIQQIKQSNQSIIKQFEQQLDQNSKIWNMSIHSLISLREAFTKSIKIIENMIDVIRNQIQQTMNEFKNMNVNHKERIKQAQESYLQTQLTHQRNIIQQIEVLKQNSSIDKLIQELNDIRLQKLNYDDQQQKIKIVEIQKKQDAEQVAEQYLKVKGYEYQLIPNSSIGQEEYCHAIAFNYNGSIVIAGCEEIIQIFEFKNNQLKKVQSLQNHNGIIFCLKFMKKSDQFISGSSDYTIKIWQANNQNQYINIQTLSEHNHLAWCLIINSNDDLIVSGSTHIFFWEWNGNKWWGLKGNKWQLDQKIEGHQNVTSLSFNDSNTKLISCHQHGLINVFEQKGKKWINSQMINVESGVRLCFISDDQFVFLPWKDKQLHFYRLNLQTNKFEKYSAVEVRNYDNDYNVPIVSTHYDYDVFPIKFIKSQNLLIVKNCQYANILRRQENFTFIQEQSIKFDTCHFNGDVSEDGKCMVMWDYETYEYQVRNLNEVQ